MPFTRKRSRTVAERTPIDEPRRLHDSMRRQTLEPNTWRSAPFATAISAPSDIQALTDLIDKEIDEVAEGLDGGTWEFQDQFISDLIAPWRAARFEEYQPHVHTAEDLSHQADANLIETKQQALRLTEQIAELRASVAAAYAVVTGREITETDLTKAIIGIDQMIGKPSSAELYRVGVTDDITVPVPEASPPAKGMGAGLLHLLTPATNEPDTDKESAR